MRGHVQPVKTDEDAVLLWSLCTHLLLNLSCIDRRQQGPHLYRYCTHAAIVAAGRARLCTSHPSTGNNTRSLVCKTLQLLTVSLFQLAQPLQCGFRRNRTPHVPACSLIFKLSAPQLRHWRSAHTHVLQLRVFTVATLYLSLYLLSITGVAHRCTSEKDFICLRTTYQQRR